MVKASRILLFLCLLSGITAISNAQQAFCLLCQDGWCIRTYQYGGACICINHDGGQCDTIGVCELPGYGSCPPPPGNKIACCRGLLSHPPTNATKSEVTTPKEMRAKVESYLQHDINAHISVGHSCKTGQKIMHSLEKQYAKKGIKLNVRYL